MWTSVSPCLQRHGQRLPLRVAHLQLHHPLPRRRGRRVALPQSELQHRALRALLRGGQLRLLRVGCGSRKDDNDEVPIGAQPSTQLYVVYVVF